MRMQASHFPMGPGTNGTRHNSAKSLQGVTLVFDRNDLTAIVGPIKAGKSMLVRVLRAGGAY